MRGCVRTWKASNISLRGWICLTEKVVSSWKREEGGKGSMSSRLSSVCRLSKGERRDGRDEAAPSSLKLILMFTTTLVSEIKTRTHKEGSRMRDGRSARSAPFRPPLSLALSLPSRSNDHTLTLNHFELP